MYLLFLFSITLSHAANKWKSLNHQTSHKKKEMEQWNTHEKKTFTHEIPTRKIMGPRKNHKKNFLDPRNSQEGAMARLH